MGKPVLQNRSVKIIIVMVTILTVASLLLTGLLQRQPSAQTTQGLGFSYLPMTPGLSAYYGLSVDAGALVTEIVPNSPADKSGLRPGDVITSFNNKKVVAGVSLLSMMRDCQAGTMVKIEIVRENTTLVKEFMHAE